MASVEAIFESVWAILSWLFRTASKIKRGAVEQDLGAHMEVLLQEGTGCEVPGSASQGGCLSGS